MEELLVFIILVSVGYGMGRYLEWRHYQSIEERETKYLDKPVVTMEEMEDDQREIRVCRLTMGSAVISTDYFKRILSSLQKIIGGRITAYETLVDRARREAILRMIENAKYAHIIQNVRVETSAIGQSANRRKAVGSVEAIAYGTAIQYADEHQVHPRETQT